MDSDFLGKVKTLLADPESLERITAIARGLSAPTPAAAPAGAFARPQSRDSRLTLLEALKPLLREDKRGKIDSLQRAMTMATVLKGLR